MAEAGQHGPHSRWDSPYSALDGVVTGSSCWLENESCFTGSARNFDFKAKEKFVAIGDEDGFSNEDGDWHADDFRAQGS